MYSSINTHSTLLSILTLLQSIHGKDGEHKLVSERPVEIVDKVAEDTGAVHQGVFPRWVGGTCAGDS